MIIAGLDIGTTGSKISIFDENGLLDSFYESYPSSRNNNIQTIDVESIKKSVFSLTKKTIDKYPQLSAIGVTSFGEAFVLLDEKDNILFDCMLYTDRRGEKEAQYLINKFGNEYFKKTTGQVVNPMFSISKILYIKNNYPDIFLKTKKILLIEDYVVYLLSGIRQIDYSLASRTQCFDVKQKKWDENLLTNLDIDINLFSKVVPTGTIAGEIKENIKEELGIKHSLLIINVAHDQIANLVGSGAIKAKSAADGLGTCECLTPIFPKTADINALADYGYGMIPFLNTDEYCCYALTNTAGALNEWVLNTFFNGTKEEKSFSFANKLLKEEPNSLFVLPYLAGSGTPYNDKSLGTIVGLELGSKKEDIYQATIECLCLENRLNIEFLKKTGVDVGNVYVSGGGSKNEMWLQIKADVLNLPIHQLENENAGSVGTAIIMGVSLGIFKTYEEGIDKLVKIKKTFVPHQEYVLLYETKYQQYVKLYQALKKEGF